MIPLGPVVARSRMNAARATVWAHLTDPNLRSQWWESFELEPGIGGAVRATGEAGEQTGVVDVWVAGHALGFTWSAPGAERGTAVLMTLRSQGYQTGITVTETGFDALADGAAQAELAGRGWTRFVEALAEADLAEVEECASAGTAGADTEAAASEVELAPLEIEGELAEDDLGYPIEVEAEPGLGDRLELVTGPIDLPNEEPSTDGSAGAAAAENAGKTSDEELGGEDELEAGLVPLVLPEPPTNTDDEEDEEPDFDSLLRGPQ